MPKKKKSGNWQRDCPGKERKKKGKRKGGNAVAKKRKRKKKKTKNKGEKVATGNVIRVFWLNIAKNWVYLWYMYCSNLFGKMRREVNFGNGVAEILRKSMREEREMMWRMEREKGISAMILSKIKK